MGTYSMRVINRAAGRKWLLLKEEIVLLAAIRAGAFPYHSRRNISGRDTPLNPFSALLQSGYY
jgi:hypothetical protein